MPESYKKLAQAAAPTATAALYTSPTATQTIIKHIRVVNYGTVAATIALYQSGSGGVDTILPPVTVEPGAWGEFDGTILMDAVDVLNFKSSVASTITVAVYGVQVS